MDKLLLIVYPGNMFSGISIYCSDPIWCRILSELNATIADCTETAAVNFDELGIEPPITPLELKSEILNASDIGRQLHQIFGHPVSLPHIQGRIVVLLHKSGGLTSGDLRHALGYAPDVATHSIDTAIYQLRKLFGREFIKNQNGVYRLGKI